MTQPTQAQIEAVKKEYLNRCGHYRPPSDETFAALTAAAQVGEQRQEGMAWIAHETKLRTIERCAQWLHDEAKALRSAASGGDGSEPGWVKAEALDEAAAAIRKLKDAP